MRTFVAGTGAVQRLAYTPDGRHLITDLREQPTDHPWMGFHVRPARELVWWDWARGEAVRRFRLRDSLYGPAGACRYEDIAGEEAPGDRNPDEHAFDVSFSVEPLRVASAWEWTNKEDGNCVFDPDGPKCVDLRTPHKTHTIRLALAPDGGALAAATVNDMDGSSEIELWPCERPPREPVPDQSPWEAIRAERLRAYRESSVELTVAPDAFVFDGRFVAAGGHGNARVQLWDTHKPIEPPVPDEDDEDDEDDYYDRPRPRGDSVTTGFEPAALAFGPGHLLVAAGAGLAVWDSLAQRLTELVRDGGAYTAVAFDHTGERLVAGTADGTIELWHLRPANRARVLVCGEGAVTAVAFAPDGLTCAAGSASGRVILWDVDA
jgi:WD40 repeat protein